MAQQTAVEWLVDRLLISGLLRLTKDEHSLYKNLKEQAKEMERQQLEDAFREGGIYVSTSIEQYYNETYKNK